MKPNPQKSVERLVRLARITAHLSADDKRSEPTNPRAGIFRLGKAAGYLAAARILREEMGEA